MNSVNNNLSNDLLTIIDDLINNRVKDVNGNIVNYDAKDRESYIKVFNEIKEGIIFNKEKFDLPSYELMVSITDMVLETIINKII